MESMRCWYRFAIAALDHPMIAMAVVVGTPSMSSTVAAVCRASWSRASRRPACFQQPLPLVVISVRVKRATVRLGEDPPLVMPELASYLALGVLPCAMLPEQRDHRIRQADRAPSRLDLVGPVSLLTCLFREQ
jgi:hypothetical protein